MSAAERAAARAAADAARRLGQEFARLLDATVNHDDDTVHDVLIEQFTAGVETAACMAGLAVTFDVQPAEEQMTRAEVVADALAADAEQYHREGAAYAAAVEAAANDERFPLVAPWLTTRCPECGEDVHPEDDDHVMTGPYVVIGCEGFYVVNPNVVGIPTPTWEDWRGDVPTPTPAPPARNDDPWGTPAVADAGPEPF